MTCPAYGAEFKLRGAQYTDLRFEGRLKLPQ